MPLSFGPTQPDSVTTVATRKSPPAARSGTSYQRRTIGGILTSRKRRSSGRQIGECDGIGGNAAGERPVGRS